MKTMHVIGSAGLGGAEKFFLRLTSALADAGKEVVCVTKPRSELNAMLSPAVVSEHLPMRSQWDYLSRWRLRRLIRSHRPAIVQTYMGRATSIATGLSGDVKHIARLGGYYRLRVYKHAHHLVGNTRGICDYLVAQGRPKEEVSYIGNFVSTIAPLSEAGRRKLRQEMQLDENAYVVISMGRLHRNKAFDVLLRAFARLIRRPTACVDLHLVILGAGPERSALNELVGELSLVDRVHMPGWVNEPESYLQAADLFVCPSRHEPLGNVILEAWNAGLPVVAADAAGPSELIADGMDGILVAREDPDALCQAMVDHIAMTPYSRKQFVSAGWKKLAEEHRPSSVLNAYLSLYSKLRDAS